MAKDFKKLASDITELAGGKDNITSVSHCMTRLRFQVRNIDKVDQKAIAELDGILGVTYQGGQFQVIVGKDLLNVYEETIKLGYTDGGVIDENLDGDLMNDKLPIGQRIIGYISASVQPMIPALISVGMIKVFLLLFHPLNAFINTGSHFQPILPYYVLLYLY